MATLFAGGKVGIVFLEQGELQGGPVFLFADPVVGFFFFEGAFSRADGLGVKVALEGVGRGGVVGDGFVVGVEEFSALPALFVGDPHAGGVARQVD